jgi:hypothetical protein
MGIRPSVTRRGLGIAAGLIIVAGPAGVLFGWDHPLAAATLLILGGGIGFRLGGRLPAAFDNVGKVRRVLWGLAALLAIVQLGRVGVFSGYATAEWASAMPKKELMRQSCLAAYVQAGALAQAGVADVWAEEHWPHYEFYLIILRATCKGRVKSSGCDRGAAMQGNSRAEGRPEDVVFGARSHAHKRGVRHGCESSATSPAPWDSCSLTSATNSISTARCPRSARRRARS